MKSVKISDEAHSDILMLQSILRGTMADLIQLGIKRLLDEHREALRKRIDQDHGITYPTAEERIYPKQE